MQPWPETDIEAIKAEIEFEKNHPIEQEEIEKRKQQAADIAKVLNTLVDAEKKRWEQERLAEAEKKPKSKALIEMQRKMEHALIDKKRKAEQARINKKPRRN